jgi:hypothetical protein
MQMPEEESFAVLVKIMQDYRMREMFKPSMAELGLCMYQAGRQDLKLKRLSLENSSKKHVICLDWYYLSVLIFISTPVPLN